MEEMKQEKPKSALEEANEVLSRLEAVKEETKSWVERAENLKAENMISGKSEAGKPQEQPEEESPADYLKRVMGGKL